ncbi:MAG: response regulator [Mariprofundus sp.]|nr:response regulator [Mariprofundus sp.]
MNTPALKRILLLEDSADDATLIVEQLQQAFGKTVSIDIASDSHHATALTADADYELYLVDYYLGIDVTGVDWVLTQRQSQSLLPPVIVLTGLDDADQIELVASNASGVSYFLKKDFSDSSDLIRAINFALKNRMQMNLPVYDKITIVMADDDYDDQLLVADAFEELKLESRLDMVNDGEALLNYLRRQGKYVDLIDEKLPGLILLDLNMPRMDGRQALTEIRADAQLRRIPVVLLTTSEAESDLLQGYDLGANSYVVKPVNFDDLVAIIAHITTYWCSIVTLPSSYYRPEA